MTCLRVRKMEVYFGHNVRVIIRWDEVCQSGGFVFEVVARLCIGNRSRWACANGHKVDQTVFTVINFHQKGRK